MKIRMTFGLILVLFSGWVWGETSPPSQVEANVNLTVFPIEMTADWTFTKLLENEIVFDFHPGVCTLDSVRVNGTDTAWNQSGNQLNVEVNNTTSPTVISFQWHANPDAQSDGIRKRDTEDTHSITAIGTPSGPSQWIPVPAGFEARLTGAFSFTLPTDMDGVATGSRVSDDPSPDGHMTRFKIVTPVFTRQLFFAMASGRQIESSTLSTLSGDLTLVLYPYPGLQQECETDLAPIPTLVPMLEQWFGAFPDTADPVFSACVMDFDQVVASPGMLALGQGFITGEGSIDKRLANGLAGQWWGVGFPVYNPAHSWVTEGLRTYSEVLVTAAETTDSEESLLNLSADILKDYDLGGTTLAGPLVVSNGDPYDHPYVLTAKGAYTLHMLRSILGDHLFFAGLKRLAGLNSHASATNRLQFALEKETRLPLGPFLKQWTDRAPRPVLRYRFDLKNDRLELDVSQPDAPDDGGPFRLPLPVVQRDDTVTIWLTEKKQRFFLPESPGTPALDPHSHILKLAVPDCPTLDAPELDFSLLADTSTYPFQLIPTFHQLPEGDRSWRIDGIPVTPAVDGSLQVREPGTHTLQLTVSPAGDTAVSQILTLQIPQPDADINGDETVDAADLAAVLRTDTADPIPNGIRDEGDISFLSHLLLTKIRNGESIAPTPTTSSTRWSLELQRESDIVAAGHTSRLNLNIHGPSALQLAVVTLEFDPDKLEPLSIMDESGMRLLFSSVTGNRWTLAIGNADAGVDCSADGGVVISSIRFRALKEGDSATVKTGEESCIFVHEADTALIPSPASSGLSIVNGSCRLPLVLNTETWETSLGLIETSDSPDEVELTALSNDGNLLATATISLQPGQRLVRTVADVFGDISGIASVQITEHSATCAWTEYLNRENAAAAACPASTDTENQLLVPHIDEGSYWNTLSGIVNCGTISSSLTFSAAGNEMTANENTPPGGGYHGRFINLLAETFLQGGWGIFDGNNAPLAGAELFYRVDHLHQAAALRLSGNTARTFYFPHIDVTGFWWTGISLINPGNLAATVQMEAFDANGHAIPDNGDHTGTIRFSLPGQTRRVDLVENFFDNRLDPKAAWIRVSSDEALTGLEVFGSRTGFQEDLSAGLEAVSNPSVSMIFPWATDGKNQQWCGLALLNPNEISPADNITVTLYDANGTVAGLAALHLDPLQKHVVLVRDLFGGTVPAGGAYIRVQSDVPLMGFELTGDDGHQWLMGQGGM